ncbi:MAG TPA: polyphosphate kinase 2 family protein [Candidatus Acidoferrum sp.]|nr:polyphosphate kinase 2 family protein [Candidatus Acidoferrum sp.]
MAKFTKELIVKPGEKVHLPRYDPEETLGWHKGHKMEAGLEDAIRRIDDLQYRFSAERKRALLIVLQGLDTAGKDGTIRHVMSGMNPQGCKVTSFKVPTTEEAAHDFLWRVHKAVPGLGEIGIFNRSHYEDVLVVRVHKLVPKEVWSERYDQINKFESILAANGTRILKFFLHISKDEQKDRLLQRIDDPKRNWKLSEADFHERKFWSDYTKAYEHALTKCSTDDAPWFIIPANKKWFRNLAVSHIIAETLEEMDPKFPPATVNVSTLKLS